MSYAVWIALAVVFIAILPPIIKAARAKEGKGDSSAGDGGANSSDSGCDAGDGGGCGGD